jgi:hypothetical protein
MMLCTCFSGEKARKMPEIREILAGTLPDSCETIGLKLSYG